MSSSPNRLTARSPAPPPALTYTPSSGYVGADGFTFKVNDGTFDSNIGAVTITVANIPPVATDQSITTSTGVAKTLTLSATDGDGNPLTYSVVTQPANGTLTGSGANLTYTPATGFNGSDSFTFKASDGLADSNTAKVSITVTTAEKPNSIWSNTATPALLDDGDGAPIELGVKFRSDFDGYITGIRFYKGIANNGIHIGNLWTSTGTLLASATFTNESSSGWQEVTFSTPVAIKANTTYVASYFTSSGHLSMTDAYFATTGVDNPPLHALRNGVDGANGLYRYTTSSAFPNSSYRSRNYWVDVLFKAATGVNIPPVAQNQSVTTAVETAKNITLTATDANGDGMTYAIVTYPSNGTISGTGANIVYTPTAGFSGVDNFTFRANDGTSNSNTATVTITVVASSQPVSIWNRAATPAIVDDGSSDPVELGMKFRSDLDGTVTGIRFYKSAANTGTHVGNLWSSTGVLLATATFRNETSTGWQEVSFSSPVAIRANTTYVASYFTQAGHLSYNDRYFATTGADAAPLHALRNGLDGGNGVYRYGTTSVFPNLSYNSRNYWVDVIFTPDGQ